MRVEKEDSSARFRLENGTSPPDEGFPEERICDKVVFYCVNRQLDARTRLNTQRIEQNGFRLIEVVDDTSRTIVWKAVQNTLDRSVIIRILKPDAAANPAEVEHFLAIARLFARIKSESIAAVFDIVSEKDLHYVVMEHVEGPTLEEFITTHGPLSADKILRIASSLIASLDQMWQTAHIVHRNLKSSTIRLDPRGVAKITDFSLAIVAGPTVDATDLDGGHIVGTPCFLSPEQAQGAQMLNTQSDMYALGVVLYHLATGKVPFEDRSVVSILTGHIKHCISPPHVLNKHLPVAFSWFLHRLMMKNPNNRYEGWEHVLHDIRHLLSGEEPSCVRPDEEYLSTIDIALKMDGEEPNPSVQDTPRVRLNRKDKNGQIASYQDKHLVKGHANEIRRDDLIRSLVCWGLLICWLALVFWFRAFYQYDSSSADILNPLGQLSGTVSQLSESIENLRLLPTKEEPAGIPADSSAEQQTLSEKPPGQPVSVAEAAPDAAKPKGAAETLPSGIPPPVIQGLALALANNDLIAARQLVKNAPEQFQEKDPLLNLLDLTPEPDAVVADFLKAQIGKPLIFEHNGKQRTVIPRSVENGIIQLEANGRGAEFPIDKLTADEKLRWMDKPQDAAACVAYCMTLLHSTRRDELHARIAGCPLLSEAFIQALDLVPAAAPPAE